MGRRDKSVALLGCSSRVIFRIMENKIEEVQKGQRHKISGGGSVGLKGEVFEWRNVEAETWHQATIFSLTQNHHAKQ